MIHMNLINYFLFVDISYGPKRPQMCFKLTGKHRPMCHSRKMYSWYLFCKESHIALLRVSPRDNREDGQAHTFQM